MDPEESKVKVQVGPQRPSTQEVEEHYATHLPYRSWCPVCIKARGQEDPHRRVKKREDGKPVIVMDYKSLGDKLEDGEEEKFTCIVMRDQGTGMIASHLCERKGDKDKWVVERLCEDIASWGHADVVLKTDGEPAVIAVQDAIRNARKHATIPENPPAYSPQSNGVAERAVREFVEQLRSVKLGLESRIEAPISHIGRSSKT